MISFPIENFDRGYFIGDFPKALFRTSAFEVSYKYHSKQDTHDKHFHRETTEYIFVAQGKVLVNGTIIGKGNVFILAPYVINEIEYLEDSELLIVKTPSIPTDRVCIKI